MDPKRLCRFIDHTLLRPEATAAQFEKLCQEAIEHSFFSVCVPSQWVSFAKNQLSSSSVKVVSVVGFPLGNMDPLSKAFEASQAKKNGADELDMVLAIGKLKSDLQDQVLEDIAAVVAAARGLPVKVIIETGLLTNSEKTLACQMAVQAGAQFVKTCSGFSGGQAEVADIILMKAAVQGQAQVKASGGIKDLQKALQLIEAGATRLGTSSGVALIKGFATEGSY